MIMIALLAADVLPSTGFSPNVMPETRLWSWASNNNMRREPSRLPQACRQAILRGKTLGACAPRMAISQASGFPLPPAHKGFLRWSHVRALALTQVFVVPRTWQVAIRYSGPR
jgi:hypothetical protein